MIIPIAPPGTYIYCQYCRDLVAIVETVSVDSTEEKYTETVTFRDPATDQVFSPQETERCKSCNTPYFYKGYFVFTKPYGPCPEGLERERNSFLETLEFLNKKAQRQGTIIAQVLDYLTTNGDDSNPVESSVFEALKKHIEEEVKINTERIRKIREATS